MFYNESLSLLTDLYQLTMAYGYWKLGRAEDQAVFHLTFRTPPFGGGYTIAAGLGSVVGFIENFHFKKSDCDYLRSLTGNDGKPLFEQGFLDYLQELKFTCDLDAIPEGTVVFPHEPLLRIQGPLAMCQLLETPLLNQINFQTLIATKAARVCQAAKGDSVLEFGLRRAQGIDGSITATRAAYIGGVSATSNVLAGKMLGIPVKGTHAHSWVMSFKDEQESFHEYSLAMPNNCVFLVDTYNTLEGVRKAVEEGKLLREQGHEMVGIRLDSGDLAYLSIEARKILDAGGFPNAKIVASNDLDERLIESLKHQGAKIDVWGVGTKLITAYDQPALGGVYKLSALRSNSQEPWEYKIKLSEQPIKISTPGRLNVLRLRQQGELDTLGAPVVDIIFDEDLGCDPIKGFVPLANPTYQSNLPDCNWEIGQLLFPVYRSGKLVSSQPRLEAIQIRAAQQLASLPAGMKRLDNPQHYQVGLEPQLHEMKMRLIAAARGQKT